MEDIKKMLDIPFVGLKKDEGQKIQARCLEIAQELFDNWGIECGDKIFRFAEIEFYYYKKEVSDGNNFDADWNRETYPRSKNAGDFFFHYSGVDICFQCHFEEAKRDNEYGEFGGILIRSLLDENQIIAGPLFCVNTMMNVCKESMPKLVPVPVPNDYQNCVLKQTVRYGINSDKNSESGNLPKLCFYATHVNGKILNWEMTSERIAWDKPNKRFKKTHRNYKNDRFKNVF